MQANNDYVIGSGKYVNGCNNCVLGIANGKFGCLGNQRTLSSNWFCMSSNDQAPLVLVHRLTNEEVIPEELVKFYDNKSASNRDCQSN